MLLQVFFPLFTALTILIIIFTLSKVPRLKTERLQMVTENRKQGNGEKLLYLFQVEECLWDRLLTNETLGMGSQYDVLALSFKRKCQKVHPSHITYVEAKEKTSWTTGRNILFDHSMKNYDINKYMYYIFADQDLWLDNNFDYHRSTYTNETWNIMKEPISPFRKFERFLFEYRPAVGAVNNDYYSPVVVNYITKSGSKMRPYYSEFLVDGQFNAYHRDVMKELLPYDSRYDHENWWTSQMIQQCKFFYRYHAHVVVFTALVLRNHVHSNYPKGKLHSYKDLCSRERLLAPELLRDENLEISLKFLQLSLLSPLRQPVYDYIVPPRHPMVKYATLRAASQRYLIG